MKSSIIIPKHISDYIDFAIKREHSIYDEKIRRDRELLVEGYRSDIRGMGEVVDLKIRETTRDVIEEEITPKINMIMREIQSINGEIVGIKKEMVEYHEDVKSFNVEMHRYRVDTDDFKVEMRALRLDTNRHDKRLTRLERVRA